MLLGLDIRNIVLIERLSLSFGYGLTVLTGETGAGKSILLDSLGLALGSRADTALVRHGSDKGSVTASFELSKGHPAWKILDDHDLDHDGYTLILRRVVKADGGSRAYINDQPASIAVLRQLGESLVEIHGQHDDRGLLDASGHRTLLDAFAGHRHLLHQVDDDYKRCAAAAASLATAREALDAAKADEEFLRHSLEELENLAPQAGEESELAERRAMMMQGEKLAGSLNEIHDELLADSGVDAALRGILRRLERLDERGQDLLQPVIKGLDRAAIEASEAIAGLEDVLSQLDFDPAEAERVEERLFAIRAMSRKHKCTADALPALRDDFSARIAALDHGDEDVRAKTVEMEEARSAFRKSVEELRQSRCEAAARLDAAVNAELAPLKLDKARFCTQVTPLKDEQWTADGGEKVAFEVSTNPGAPFGPLIKIASGGELARFILALKVSLADKMEASTLIFDEVDRGIGGATADAVGERLARLADDSQVLVVTHSPQVAARGTRHLQIAKTDQAMAGEQVTVTDVIELDPNARREEIARMLSGASITDEARAAAHSLMQKSA